MSNKQEHNYKLVVEDNNYPRKGSISALIGIYPTNEGAVFIKNIIAKRYPESNILILKTSHSATVVYPENFTAEKLNRSSFRNN